MMAYYKKGKYWYIDSILRNRFDLPVFTGIGHTKEAALKDLKIRGYE